MIKGVLCFPFMFSCRSGFLFYLHVWQSISTLFRVLCIFFILVYSLFIKITHKRRLCACKTKAAT